MHPLRIEFHHSHLFYVFSSSFFTTNFKCLFHTNKPTPCQSNPPLPYFLCSFSSFFTTNFKCLVLTHLPMFTTTVHANYVPTRPETSRHTYFYLLSQCFRSHPPSIQSFGFRILLLRLPTNSTGLPHTCQLLLHYFTQSLLAVNF